MSMILANYTKFLDKYKYLYDEIIRDEQGVSVGGEKEAAQNEANASQTKLSNAQSRFTLCIATQIP